MARQDFIPTAEGAFRPWLANFSNKVREVLDRYGLTEQDAAELGDHAEEVEEAVSAVTDARAAARRATRRKARAHATAEQVARALARRIKSDPAFTAADGALLGIEGPEDATELAAARPRLTVTLAAGHARVAFAKDGSDGINLYSRRGTETAFAFLARDTQSPYVDTRPNHGEGPETRFYQAFYVHGDDEVGQSSDIVEVMVPA